MTSRLIGNVNVFVPLAFMSNAPVYVPGAASEGTAMLIQIGCNVLSGNVLRASLLILSATNKESYCPLLRFPHCPKPSFRTSAMTYFMNDALIRSAGISFVSDFREEAVTCRSLSSLPAHTNACADVFSPLHAEYVNAESCNIALSSPVLQEVPSAFNVK